MSKLITWCISHKWAVLVYIILSICAVMADNARADDILGISDKASLRLANTTSLLFIADWGTSLDILNHKDIHERNNIIGANPSRRHINQYFISKFALHYFINTHYPEYRNIWNIWQLGITYSAVNNNIGLGLRVKF